VTAFVEWEIVGNKSVGDRITLVGRRASDLKPVMAELRKLIIEGHKAQFEDHGQKLGTPWPPLSQQTVARKEREGLPDEPLVATRALQTALAGGAGRSTTVTRSMVRVGVSRSRLFYAIFAAKGRTQGRGREPARPITGMNVAEGEEALSMIQRFVMEGLT
jgi:hypothetical protein